MKFKAAKLKDLSIADLKVLQDESDKQIANFSQGSPDYNYHESMLNEIAKERSKRISDLVEKEEDEKTDAEKEADENKK